MKMGARVVALVTISTGFALAADPKAPPSSFEAMDGNGDGKVSAREHTEAASALFATMDANRDGKVTAGEMDQAQAKITGRKAAAKDMSSAEKIKVIDKDGDGILTAAEHAAGSRAMFERMDTNKDGYLSKQEWDAGHAALMKKPAK